MKTYAEYQQSIKRLVDECGGMANYDLMVERTILSIKFGYDTKNTIAGKILDHIAKTVVLRHNLEIDIGKHTRCEHDRHYGKRYEVTLPDGRAFIGLHPIEALEMAANYVQAKKQS